MFYSYLPFWLMPFRLMTCSCPFGSCPFGSCPSGLSPFSQLQQVLPFFPCTTMTCFTMNEQNLQTKLTY